MKTAVLATLVGSAAAFAPQGVTKFSTAVESAAMDELKDIARNNQLPVGGTKSQLMMRILENGIKLELD